MRNGPGKPVFIFFGKADMKNWIKMKNVQIASDAVPYLRKDGTFAPISAPYKEFQGHPRIAGTRGFIFRVSREEGIPLMDTLTNTGYITAKMLSRLGLKDMQERGRMQEGMIADITIFNSETIRENSTYKIGEQGLPTTGIPYVLVNGHFVVRDSKVDIKVRPGQPIRYPVKK